ncbi:MAG: phospholipid carrier-dependent glycosyltransferase [Actinomycetota bacterium]
MTADTPTGRPAGNPGVKRSTGQGGLKLPAGWVFVLIVLLAAGLRFVRLGQPEDIVFDEVYYARDACIYLGAGQEACQAPQATEQSFVHPPTGKWLIALGIKLFGYNFFGQRFMAALFGVALVIASYHLAHRLFRKPWISAVSATLVAVDFLLLVQSRIAMLDVFLAFFVVLALLFVAIDRERVLLIKQQLSDGRKPSSRGLRWRLAAGGALGLAMSVKWSAIYALATAALLSLSWSFGLWKLQGRPRSRLGRTLGSIAVLGLVFGLLPLTLYLASYFDYYRQRAAADCAYLVPAASADRTYSAGRSGLVEGECLNGVRGVQLSLADLHQRMASYHLGLEVSHPYQSKAWSWPLVLRPVAYHWSWLDAEGTNRNAEHIVAMGNVVTWYGALAAAGWLIVRSIKKWRPETVVLAAWAAQYVPWLLVQRPLFFFYMTPAVPFMMIGLAAALHTLWLKGGWARRAVWTFFLLISLTTVLFYPVLTALSIPYDAWRMLMWMDSFDCGGLKCGWI